MSKTNFLRNFVVAFMASLLLFMPTLHAQELQNSSNSMPDDQPVPVAPQEEDKSGILVAITIKNSSGDAVKNTEVSLDSVEKAHTDDAGLVTFSRVSAGNHTVKVGNQTFEISVQEGGAREAQTFSLTLKPELTSATLISGIILGLAALVILWVAFSFLKFKKPKKKTTEVDTHTS